MQWSVLSKVLEVADRNAELVAEELSRQVAQVGPSVVLLAGEQEARDAVRRKLPDHLAELVTVTDRGSRNEADRPALRQALDEAAWAADRRLQRALLERWGDQRAAGLVVTGLAEVCHAARLGALDTLLLTIDNPDAGTPAEALRQPIAIGPDPIQVAPSADELRAELVESGADPNRLTELREAVAEAALVRAAATTGARIEVVTTAAARFRDDVGALVRFDLPALR